MRLVLLNMPKLMGKQPLSYVPANDKDRVAEREACHVWPQKTRL